MGLQKFVYLAAELEHAGLIWQPEIGDEISDREKNDRISILIDPDGMNPKQLRQSYLWLPTVEQIVFQFEARQAILFHAGLELSERTICYKTVVQASFGPIESSAESLREALGVALKELLIGDSQLH
jgi:hypothetical protein